MEVVLEFADKFVSQLQSPALAFLLAGFAAAALGSKIHIPGAINQFTVFMLLMAIGLRAGTEIREGNILEMAVPALFSSVLGACIVLLGSITLARLPGVRREDALATSGLFGAVSASTMAAAILALEEAGIFVEAWVAALYPFMDIPALILAIVLANIWVHKQKGDEGSDPSVASIAKDSLRGSALTALLAGVAIGLLTQPSRVVDEFYDPLFLGFLSILMFTLGIDAFKEIRELLKVAHWYALYAFVGPVVHGLMGFGLGYIAHMLVGLSPGGVIMLAVLAASNSDVSGPPTLRAGIPSANPSTYLGTSTGVGTPVAIAICIPLFIALGKTVFPDI
jgi:hypothetical protein